MDNKTNKPAIFLFILMSLTFITIGAIDIYGKYAYGYSSRWNVIMELWSHDAEVYGAGFILFGLSPLSMVYGLLTQKKKLAIWIFASTLILGILTMLLNKQIAAFLF